uniref:Uncharacterized protein n=1 Tax=Arundo donax TaxID=35708 RepID=A0A0A9H5Q8_ARUDO
MSICGVVTWTRFSSKLGLRLTSLIVIVACWKLELHNNLLSAFPLLCLVYSHNSH